jgi:hypothetical protein
MALPSNPQHGSVGTLNGSDYVFDSDRNGWVVTFTDKDKILQANIDSEVIQMKSMFYAGAQSAGYPVGSIIPFAHGNLPSGFLLANGTQFNTVQYPQLFEYLGSEYLPDFSNRDFGFKVYDQEQDHINYTEVSFGIAAYNGAGLNTDSELMFGVVQEYIISADSDNNVLRQRIQTLEEDLAQAVADRVFTDNQLTTRLNDHDSDLNNTGRFYVQATPPSGGPNSGWVNTTNMRLHVWDETADVWVEVNLT